MKYRSKITNDIIFCKELSVVNYKELLKCSFGEQVDNHLFVKNFVHILSEVTNKDVSYLNNLSLIDIVYLIFDIYSNSVGTCKITITYDEKTLNVELNLDKMKQLLFSHNNCFIHTVDAGSIKIIMESPTLERSLQPTKYLFLDHIKGIQTDTYIPIKTNEQAAKLVENLTPQIVNEIVRKYESTNNALAKINFLSIYGLDHIDLNFFPTFNDFLWLFKLLFGDSLSNFYENFFHLSYSGKLNAEFIEKISVGEFNYFIGLLKSVLNNQSQSSSNETSTQHDVGINEH